MTPNIRELMTLPDLFSSQFAGNSWSTWRALLSGFYGLELTNDELADFRAVTGLQEAPSAALDELWLVVGRRGGKSQMAALLAILESAFRDYSDKLSPGELATVFCIAADRKQSRVIMRYVSGLLHSNPMLERMIVREDKESIELSNRTIVEVGTASFRSVRGYTIAAVICDELAFWRSDESANPDTEIIGALRPAMATLEGKLIALSSPYAKRGELWNTYRRYYGKPGPILVAQAPSRTMNPELPERVVKQAMERDASAAQAEYGAQFRSDLETFIQREVIDSAVRTSPLELPFDSANEYHAFTDPAGGGQDEYCLAIAHHEDDRTVIDLLRARRGVPAEITAGYADLLKSYGIKTVTGDKYAGSWPADEFQKHGIKYVPAGKPKSDLYVDSLAAFNSGRVELPPDDKLVNQLINLERRTSRAGKDSIDHAVGSHDDRANVVCGAVATKADEPVVQMFLSARNRPKQKPPAIRWDQPIQTR